MANQEPFDEVLKALRSTTAVLASAAYLLEEKGSREAAMILRREVNKSFEIINKYTDDFNTERQNQ